MILKSLNLKSILVNNIVIKLKINSALIISILVECQHICSLRRILEATTRKPS